MQDRLKTFGVLSLCVLGSGCDEARSVEREFEPVMASANLELDAPMRETAEPLQRHKLEPTPFEPQPLDRPPTCGPSTVPTPADLCPEWRVVAQFKKGPCPPPYAGDPPEGDHWTVESLFAGVDDVPAGLQGYCRYTWTGEPGTQTPLPASIKSVAKPDCIVFPQSPMAVAMGEAYEHAFLEGTRPLPSTPSGGHAVAVAVVDTAPGSASLDQAGHGQTMAAIAGELAAGCVPKLGETNNCKRKVRTWLGLPQTETGPDFSKGGFYGYQTDLALGILQALEHWPEVGDEKLIVNLSVGWEPVAGEFSTPTPAVQAVRDAIAAVRCQGGLVITASGNRPVGTCFDGGTGPGGWEREPGPSVAQCQSLGFANPAVPNPAPSYYPFVYAATPLDWHGQNLASYREESNTRLSITGFAGYDVVDNKAYGPATGSSVASAALSGTAAVVWSYFHWLSADRVMDLIYENAEPTGRDADIYTGQAGAPTQHQVTVCGVLANACDQNNINNWLAPNHSAPSVCSSNALAHCEGGSPEVDLEAWSDAFTIAFGQLDGGDYGNSAAPSDRHTINCTQCGGPQITQISGQFSTEPEHMGWVLPQPHKHPCPLCHVKGPDLYLSLDPEYDGLTLQTFSVYLSDSAGGSEVLHYSHRDLTNVPSSTSVEVLFDTEFSTVTSGLPPMRAEIAMTFEDPTTGRLITASNPLSIN